MKQLLLSWCKSRFWLLLTFIAILMTSLLLSVLLTNPQLTYTFQIFSTIILVGCTIDLWKYHRHLQHTYRKLTPPFEAVNSWSTTLSEYTLWQTITQLNQQIQALSLKLQTQTYSQLDYYTLWAHQIKTPISASQLIIKQIPHSPQTKVLEQELFKIERYVELVLHFLRMETFHQDLNLKRESLDELVRDVLKQYSLLFINKKISLQFEPSQYTFITDRKWFTLLIEQLISNAIKYTSPQGSIRIFFENQQLIIQDTGIGIHTHDIPRVFERGFTGFNGRFNQNSSGLGLYIAKALADKFHYTLTLKSQVNVGTTLSIHLNEAKIAQD